ncbi:MAG: hypothetical protein J0I47_14665 [Sphingomonas sp.]|uniref:hypothetical protein n=1 Tax=Sphingomonas sp. TaxID=28214 RepID=UPI001AC39234|nr:hypothetical protein [Sphingomonas sp.]MBN8809460.1 hypothetical protein [Sphingomonas sp.]
MATHDDTELRDYYARRATEERQRAVFCADDSAAIAHLQMAREYDRRVTAMKATPVPAM